jgi:hypothetical protein
MVYHKKGGAIPMAALFDRRSFAWLAMVSILTGGLASGAEPEVRVARPESSRVIVPSGSQPEGYRYLAFPSLLRVDRDEVWLAYKAGRTHATDAGAAIEVVRHILSTGATTLIQRLPAPPPKLYQMGELTRLPDGSIALYIDVQSIGWDNRHYRSGAEVFRWDPARKQFGAPAPLGPVNGLIYGYPLDFISEGRTTWQLIMAFGYHQPGGRWSVDAIRSEDSGKSWEFVCNLTEEFGGIRGNESGFVRHADGFIVTTRGYDRMERLHRTDRNFRVQHQVDLTGKYTFMNSHIGRPRLFIREGHGYLQGRNYTKPTGPSAMRGATASEMQLCMFRFDPQTLALTSCVVLDNAEQSKVTDGYYAVTTFSGAGDETKLHVFTYKGVNQSPPEILRLDFRWSEVK